MKTYKDVIDLIEASSKGNGIYVPVFYVTGTYEWLPVDKQEYLRQLKMIDRPEAYPFPCRVEQEKDGELYIHPKESNS